MAHLFVCTSCRVPAQREAGAAGDPCGERLLEAVQAAAEKHPGIAVQGTSCLMGCSHGCNVALSEPGKLSYVLGRFEPSMEDAEAVVEYAALYHAGETGVVPYREWPQGVKGHFIARIPPVA